MRVAIAYTCENYFKSNIFIDTLQKAGAYLPLLHKSPGLHIILLRYIFFRLISLWLDLICTGINWFPQDIINWQEIVLFGAISGHVLITKTTYNYNKQTQSFMIKCKCLCIYIMLSYRAIPPLGKPHDQIFKLYLTLKLWYHFEEHHLKLWIFLEI